MKLVKSVVGIIAVLFSIQPLASWAATANQSVAKGESVSIPSSEQGVEVQNNSNLPVDIQRSDDGKITISISSTATPDTHIPQCTGGGLVE
jgi:hypothetical protein